jgi:hypothetical protein
MGFLTRAIGRRLRKRLLDFAATPEGQAAIERSRRTRSLVETTCQIAGSDLDDESACSRLREQLPQDPEAVRRAIEELGNVRTAYLDDRAYRLLTAAVDDAPVRPIDPSVRSLFLEEARLGRMSLDEAFEYLASLEPRLRELETRRMERPRVKQGWSRGRDESEFGLVGRFAESPHDLVKTDLAWSVVREYRAVRRHGGTADLGATPFFERRKRTGGFTFALFQKDTRPRAHN